MDCSWLILANESLVEASAMLTAVIYGKLRGHPGVCITI